jgi:CRISPR-associated protein Csm1
MYTGLDFSTKLWVGDYISSSDLEDLAGQSKGIKRLAVLRADVDDLGSAFITGFERSGEQTGEQTPEEKYKYQTLSRTAAFSRQMSLFFKYYINQILRGNFGLPQYSLTRPDKPAEPRRVAIVYSGGDDVFIVGAWNEVIETAVDLQKAFEKYCLGSLTISAGLGVFENKYPISRMAFETADLEEKAKAAPEKNSLALFTAEAKTVEGWQEDHTYSWTEFTDAVVGEKLQVIRNFFEHEEQERGRAFLYKLLEFLRKSGKEKINVARYAYLLARLEPRRESPHYKAYLDFSGKMYNWIFDDRDKKQVITAIYLYVYLSRKKEVDKT